MRTALPPSVAFDATLLPSADRCDSCPGSSWTACWLGGSRPTRRRLPEPRRRQPRKRSVDPPCAPSSGEHQSSSSATLSRGRPAEAAADPRRHCIPQPQNYRADERAGVRPGLVSHLLLANGRAAASASPARAVAGAEVGLTAAADEEQEPVPPLRPHPQCAISRRAPKAAASHRSCSSRLLRADAIRPGAGRSCPASPRSMEVGSVDELLDVTVERPVLDQLQVEVGRTLEDRVQPGLTGDDREERHLQAVD